MPLLDVAQRFDRLVEAVAAIDRRRQQASVDHVFMLTAFPAGLYPNLEIVARELVAAGFRYIDEYEAGLDLILDGIERAWAAANVSPKRGGRSAPA